MKKLLSLVLCLVLMTSIFCPAYATEQTNVIYSELIYLEDGISVLDELFVTSTPRSTDKTATRRQTYKKGDTVIGIIAFRATFRYDGSSVSVISKSVTQTDTYDGYSYSQTSFTSSGGTVTLEGKLSKLLVINLSFSMSLTCDKNGNLST